MDNNNLLEVIERFSCARVLVIGEAMLDLYLDGVTDRLCREAPVPVVRLTGRRHAPGGAANTAANVAALGGQAHLISVAGGDPEGRLLLDGLQQVGVDTQGVLVHPDRPTLAKQRVMAAGQMLVRYDQGATDPLDPSSEAALIAHLQALYPACDALIISDYGYGILTPAVVAALAALQAAEPRLILADSKRLARYAGLGLTAVKPNYAEAVRLLGLERLEDPLQRAEQVLQHGPRILDLAGAQVAAVTMDHDGAWIFERGAQPYRTYARPAPHSRAAGAGDTFVAAFALALASGVYSANAAELASAAASVVVSQDGTAACSSGELRAYFTADQKHITDAFALAGRLQSYRRDGRRIVFTNGCFDILHRGHISYLNSAKALGDILVVGINSDDSVRRLKGPDRPINSLEDRIQVLSALSCIDHLVAFDGDTPRDLIRVVQPEVFVKGGDYTRATLPETPLVEELGGQVVILPYLEDRSTTNIIRRIRTERQAPAPRKQEPR
ncbi:MAG: D-glycero-beta-D-manno-heptose 1-phosphate adenylyltransferase [Chloroflexota bacterium]